MVLAPAPLATPIRRGFRFPALLRWWHLLSLDAPSVAALWSWSFARTMHIRLPWSAPLLLATGTWLIYIADRILDGLRANTSSQLRERHFFYARHRRRVLTAAAFVSLVLLWLIFTHMNPVARREDVTLFAAALIYFCLIHVWAPQSPTGIERWFPKELAVAVVFAAAVAVPTWSRLQGQKLLLAPLVALFALLCWLNCVAIDKWEKPNDEGGLKIAQPHLTTRRTQRHLPIVSCGLALLTAVASARSILSAQPIALTALYIAIMISALLFFAFDRSHDHSRLSAIGLRIAADVALLTPLLFLPALR